MKILLSLGIVSYLVWDATRAKGDGNIFVQLVSRPKDWGLLAAAWGVLMTATVLTFVRWWHLARALGVPCRLAETMRIAFWGILFNLAPLGVVGGDLIKAVMLGREYREHRAGVVASVLVDRAIGLYALFLFASMTILCTGFWRSDADNIRLVCNAVFGVTVAGSLAAFAAMMPDITGGRGSWALRRIPRVGPMIEQLVSAMRLYRHELPTLVGCSLISVGIQTLSVIGYFLIARGLPGSHPTLVDHFVIIPLSVAAGVVPLPLGPMELVIEFFYSQTAAVAKGQGLVVALVYRLIFISIAAIGVVSCLGIRGRTGDVIEEAESHRVAA